MTMADAVDMTASSAARVDVSQETLLRNRKFVRFWLYFVLFTLFALVIVGGATRLTESGLSITEWKPIHGVIPPLSEAEWQEELEKYRQIPEYQQINKGMSSMISRPSSGGSGRIGCWRAVLASFLRCRWPFSG